MTPKEKANELIANTLQIMYGKKPSYKKSEYFKAKKMGKLFINEIIEVLSISAINISHRIQEENFWQEVLKEIDNQ